MGSGFGFIRPDIGKVNDKDLYFHCTACSRDTTFDQLHLDDKVSYEPIMDDRKKQPTASNVQLISGGGGGGGGGGRGRYARSDSRDRNVGGGRRCNGGGGRGRRDSRERDRGRGRWQERQPRTRPR